MTNGQYTLNGTTYKMDIHGFAKDMTFKVEKISHSHMVFTICNTDETYQQYPYKIVFVLEYVLDVYVKVKPPCNHVGRF